MQTFAIIPARYASTRFPGKPLVEIQGKSMIRRVYEQALSANIFSRVVVATDDERIFNHVQAFGGEVVMTSPHHLSGTDRCGEVLASGKYACDVVFNIQGDEPFIQPEQLQLLHKVFENPMAEIATLVKSISDEKDIANPNVVKVVFSKQGQAMYFSRSAIPFARNIGATYYRHIGLYAFRSNILSQLVTLAPTDLERSESLEQLRWLENGFHINVAETQMDTIGIDTPDDLLKI